ncbi:MAG: SAM-dependent methyltransferase [Oleiphilus sp.]
MNPLANTTSEPESSVILDSGMTETIEHTLSSSEQFAHHKNINNYYDSPAVAFFEQLAQQQIHLGYWDDKYPNVSFANAAKRLSTVIISQLDVTQDSHLLDIGCGCGMPAIDIIQERGCWVEGITINPQQQQKANALALKTGLSQKARFRVGDAAKLPYQDQQFDCTLLLESIHHIGHQEALDEAWRVLKPGGQILIADGVALKEKVSPENKQCLSNTFVAKTLATKAECLEILETTGFTGIETLDLTRAIQPTWRKLAKATEANKTRIIQDNNPDFFNEMLEFWKGMDSVWSNNARYLIFKAYKK